MSDAGAAAAAALAVTAEGPPGAPVVVLGSSLGTTGDVWRRQREALRGSYRVLCYEHRGHGGSPAPPGPYTIAGLAADVLGVLDAHAVDSASYVGISLGGMVGMWLAARAPERVDSLVLCCTSAHLPPAGTWLQRAAQVRSAGLAAISGQVVGGWFTPAFRRRDPGTFAAFVAMLEGTDPEGYAGCCEAIAAMDLRPLLPSIQAPTLVVAGADDQRTPPPHGAAIAAAVPRSRLRVIRGAAHLASVSHPAETTALIQAHLAERPG